MATKFPPPPEVLAHPQGHLCYAIVPRKKRGFHAGYIGQLHMRKWPWHWKAYGEPAATPLEAFENAIASAVAQQVQYGHDLKIGVPTPKQRTEYLQKVKARRAGGAYDR